MLVPRSLLKLLLSAFALGLLMLGPVHSPSAVCSLLSTAMSTLHHLDIPVTTAVHIESSRVR